MILRWVTPGVLGLASVLAHAGDFEFVVIGDTRPRFESESFRPFENLMSKINESRPALVVNLGDLIYGYGPRSKESQWNKYQAVIKGIQVPYYQLPGNHDTHSKQARRVYARRFARFYQSFDYGDCHFVLLDNTENERWGFLGPTQLSWLRQDLKQARARSVFVFLHFPVWEPDRITPEYYDFWATTLHPLFKESRVRAVFGGHYHTYGPTREFDGIRYFITGGGGAELRPDYRKSGGQHHFMKVKVSGDAFDVRVITEHGELTDPEADVMGGVQFAARNVSRIGIKPEGEDLKTGVAFTISVQNPYQQVMKGRADWSMDASAFSIEPPGVLVEVPAGGKRDYQFSLKMLQSAAILPSLPQIEFNVAAGGIRHRFHREVRIIQSAKAPYRTTPPRLDGRLADWDGVPVLKLAGAAPSQAELRACHNAQTLYLALCVQAFEATEAKEVGFSDEIQIGIAGTLSKTEFGRDLLRLGFNSDLSEPRDRTPGHKPGTTVPGIRSACRTADGRTCYELALPLRTLPGLKLGPGSRVVMDLSFLAPEPEANTEEPPEPKANSFAYRVRYGSDSLVPVYFVEVDLEGVR